MQANRIEHVNLTVHDPQATAGLLCRLFDWHIRWSGPTITGGQSVHIGTDDSYLAIYTPGEVRDEDNGDYAVAGRMNHIGIQVNDLDEVEARVRAAGLEPYNHGHYEPGRRFYFRDTDGVEYEVVSYGAEQVQA